MKSRGMPILPVSSENNHFQHLEVLKRNRTKRTEYKEFLVEGVNPINQVLKNKWQVVAFAYSKERGLSDWAKKIITETPADFHLNLTPELLERLSDKDESSELLATVRMRENDPNLIPLRTNALVLVMDRPSNPGNLGSTIRSCDAFGVDGLIITGHSVDLYDPVTIRSSIGALFALPIVRMESHKEVSAWLLAAKSKGIDFQAVGTSSKGEANLDSVNCTGPTVILLGNETSGLSAGYRQMTSLLARIPICGVTSSLNLSCAASIVLYEVMRQRKWPWLHTNDVAD